LPGACLPNYAVLLNRLYDGLLLDNGAGERFFTVDVLLPVGRFGGQQGVPMVRHSDHDRVNIVAGQEFAVVVVCLAILVAVAGVDGIHSGPEVVGLDVAGRDDLAIGLIEEDLGVARPHHAPADDAEGDAVRGCGACPGTRGHDGGNSGRLEEIAAGKGGRRT